MMADHVAIRLPWASVLRVLFLPICALAIGLTESGEGGGERHQAAIAAMSFENGVVHLEVMRGPSFWGSEQGGESPEGGGGWLELWQEGHVLLLNTSIQDEIHFEVPPDVDTYLWATVYNPMGERVCESNIVHAGSAFPFSLEITHIGEGGRPWLHEETWRDTESLSLTFQLTLSDRGGSESGVSGRRGNGQVAEIDSVQFILNNQTHGMMRLGDAGILEHSGTSTISHVYRHKGEIEVGRHRIQLAALEKGGQKIPRVLSNIVWGHVRAHRVPSTFNSSQILSHLDEQQRLAEGGGGRRPRGDGGACELSFQQCFTRAQERIPPNRQYTESLDAADACAIQHCGVRGEDGWDAADACAIQHCGVRGEDGWDAADACAIQHCGVRGEDGWDADLRALMRGALIRQLDSHLSSVASGLKVPESLLHCARLLQLLGEGEYAARALEAAIRFVGARSHLLRSQCTYPGCKELAKDACGILHRLQAQNMQVYGNSSREGYIRHLESVVPSPGGDGQTHGPFRYPVSSIAFAVLTTKPSYRSRARAVKRTWFKHVTRGGFYGDEEDDELPVFPYSLFMDQHVDEAARALLADMVARADYMSSLPKFFLALHDIYVRNKDADWFVLAGDDNFMVPQHFPPLLDDLDSSKKIIAGGPLGIHIGVWEYLSGGSGLIFSRGYMLAAVDRIAPFAVSWIQGRGIHYLCHPCADIAFGVFSQDLGADVIEVQCMHGMWPEYFSLLPTATSLPRACSSLARAGSHVSITCARPASFHYVQPRAMRLLDHFFFRHRGVADDGA